MKILHSRNFDYFSMAVCLVFFLFSTPLELYIAINRGTFLHSTDMLAGIWQIHVLGIGDPIYLDRPGWFLIMTLLDGIFFGPFYLVFFYAIAKKRSWIRPAVLVYAGSVIYSNIVYVGWEYMFGRVMAHHPVIFFFENLPWFIVPALWAVRFHKKAWE
jgi:hypothetical protein